MMDKKNINGVMFNAYPDSIGTSLKDTIQLFKKEMFKDAFSFFYVLPTFFNSDLDRGFSIIDYNLNEALVIVISQSGRSPDILAQAKMAKEAGAFFSSNPGIRQITTRANTVLNAAKYMSLISINEVEAAALVTCLSAVDKNLDWGKPVDDEPVLQSEGGAISLLKFCETHKQYWENFPTIPFEKPTQNNKKLWDSKLNHTKEVPGLRIKLSFCP